MQTASDIFLGHMRVANHDYYVRQFRDMKVIPSGKQISGFLPQFAAACGHALAKSHARSGDPEAIARYIGIGAAFADGILRYARAYAEQTCADHADLRTAIANKEVKAAERGWWDAHHGGRRDEAVPSRGAGYGKGTRREYSHMTGQREDSRSAPSPQPS